VPKPPRPPARNIHVASPHGTRADPYFWLRDDSRSSAEVLEHLRAENSYIEAMLAPHATLMEELYQEIVGRLKQDDTSVPVRFRGFWYQSRFETGQEYPVLVRWPDVSGERRETVLLDCNQLAGSDAFFQLGGYAISLDNRLIAYTEDRVGRRQYRIRVKDIESGRLLDDVIENAEADVVWAADNRTLLYVEKDPVTLLAHRVRRHVLGTSVDHDTTVYEELDETFDVEISASKSERYIFIASESTTSSEWRYARIDDPELRFEVFAPREEDHEYQLDHLGDRFYVRTNRDAQNFRIVTAPIGPADPNEWRDLIAHADDVFIDDFEVFRDFIAVGERSGGLRKIRVQRWGEVAQHLSAADPTYTMRLASNPDPDSTRLRYIYTSLTTPATTFEYDIRSGELELLKREPVLGGVDPANYASEFVWAPARDGERVPVSVVYRKSTPRNGTAPLYLYAYGAYGLCSDPSFSSALLSLLDRGFVYAIAHVRGGQELGRRWYDAGRQQHKRNTFTDFIDVTDYLVAHGYGARDRVFAAGGSAGGLLVGAVMNMAPEKYAGVIAHVPFVDIVTTMLDETIPLTTLEYDEWGNPNERADYEYMLSYSPYDNVTAQAYPPVLVTTGLWDSQVQYFEPAKWVAKLRALKTDDNPVLLHVNMDAGHGGKTGRFEHLREVAREYAFVIAIAEQGRRAWEHGPESERMSDEQEGVEAFPAPRAQSQR
jgi:oligopeptidase B